MTHAALALQQAVYQTLVDDDDLTILLGGANVHDDVPRQDKPPYIVFAEATHSDWSTGTEKGLEHSLAVEIWSRERGRKQVLDIAEAVQDTLASLPQLLDSHHLVNFTHEFTEVTRDEETGYFVAKASFRAVTEPLPVIPQ